MGTGRRTGRMGEGEGRRKEAAPATEMIRTPV